MDRVRFEQLVEEALDTLPDEFASELDNISITVQDLPSRQQLSDTDLSDPYHLLGLYEGVNLTRRSRGYAGALPDQITIFKVPIERMCHTEDDIRSQVRKTVMHELGHYFGMDEEQLREIED